MTTSLKSQGVSKGDMNAEFASEPFISFAIVQIKGRNVIAGKVTEIVIAGHGSLLVEVPGLSEKHKEFQEIIEPGSIYGMTPCTQDDMIKAALRLRAKPLGVKAVEMDGYWGD